MTIRLRLTFLITALLGAVGLLWGVALVGGLWLTLERIAETDVRDKVHVIDDYLVDLDRELRREGRQLALTSFDALPRAFSDDGMFLQLTAPDGAPLNRSPNLGERRLPLPAKPELNTIDLDVGRPGGAREALMAARPLVLPGRGNLGWVLAAYPLERNERTVSRFAAMAAASWLLFVSVAVMLGYYFAGRALAPVVAMTEGVERMRSTELPWRVRINHPPQDEIDRLGATFNALFERLEATFEAKRRFVADASHELKTPLTAILGNLRLIRARGPAHPAEVPGWAEAASREAERLARLVESLLVLAQSSEGQLALERLPVDLAEVAREVVAEFRVLAPRVTLACGERAWVIGDRDRLKQVAINLVDNALRATREGGEVEVRVKPGREFVRLIVADTGIGMPPEALPRIFNRFYRVDEARDRAYGGSGLGLAITAALVEDHDGFIDVESTDGVGTRFEVRLPAAHGDF